MKKHLALLASVLLLGGFASAQSIETENDFEAAVNPAPEARPVSAKSSCAAIKLTDDQKTQMKAAFTQFETSKKALEANEKAARKAYFKALTDTATAATASQAQSLTANLTDAMAKLIDARANFRTQVMFTILTPEQRLPAVKCEMAHRKHRKHEGRGGRRHHKGGKKGGEKKSEETAAPAQA